MKPFVGRNTTVLPLQNGVDAVPQLTAELGSDVVIGGLCKINLRGRAWSCPSRALLRQ